VRSCKIPAEIFTRVDKESDGRVSIMSAVQCEGSGG
jgi:hypothetical protein